ncbi:hypothetical protein [Streptomyces fructofermentans]|uniref:hypothetical protein n=1 Tax=Streptomyces fructofermentans TaxID=152141 RepID=UPI0037A15436
MRSVRSLPRTPRRPVWPRFLVALAAVLCAVCAAASAGGHLTTGTAPPAAVSTESGLEHPHDLPDTAPRPSGRQGHRLLAHGHPGRPVVPRPARFRAPSRSAPAPAPSSYAPGPRTLRCMVLRC